MARVVARGVLAVERVAHLALELRQVLAPVHDSQIPEAVANHLVLHVAILEIREGRIAHNSADDVVVTLSSAGGLPVRRPFLEDGRLRQVLLNALERGVDV